MNEKMAKLRASSSTMVKLRVLPLQRMGGDSGATTTNEISVAMEEFDLGNATKKI